MKLMGVPVKTLSVPLVHPDKMKIDKEIVYKLLLKDIKGSGTKLKHTTEINFAIQLYKK